MPLTVHVGPSYQQQALINVNDDEHPVLIDSEHFTGRIIVRIRDFTGTIPPGETRIKNTPYFNGRKRKFSIQVEGRFKQAVTADDVYFGVDFDNIPAIPKIFDIGMAAARMIDPAVYYSGENEKPYIMSPLVCGINAFNITTAPELCSGKEVECSHGGEDSSQEEEFNHDNDHDNDDDDESESEEKFYDAQDCRDFDSWPITNRDDFYAPADPTSFTGIPPPSHRMSWPAALDGHEVDSGAGGDDDDSANNLSPMTTTPMTMGRRRRGTDANTAQHSLMMAIINSNLQSKMFNALPLSEYKLGKERALEEDTRLQLPGSGPNSSMPYKTRRKYFLNQANRQKFQFTPDKQYGFDFYSPYMDFNNFQLKLGISVKVDKYLNGRPIRYVCRSLDARITYFVITFSLEH